MSETYVDLNELYGVSREYCQYCPELEECVIIDSINKLDDWIIERGEISEKGLWGKNPETIEALILRPLVGGLLGRIIEVQADCVVSMEKGTGHLMQNAVQIRRRSSVGDIAGDTNC